MRGSSDVPSRLPLQHVRATVLTQAWAGALATRFLADMGAEVIQVESLGRIDPWRGGYPPHLSGTYPCDDPGDRPFDRNAAYNSVNNGKKAITLDLNRWEAKEAFLELVSISDIVAENFSARVLPNLGLEYPVLKEVNPTVILLRMGAYGSWGPYANFMGNGGSIEPMSGISSLLGYSEGPPMNSGVMHSDPYAGLIAMSAMLVALHHRSRTGVGQEIDLSQQETSIGLIADRVMEFSMSGRSPERRGNYSARMAPHNNYRCLGDDAWVAISVRSDEEWGRLCRTMGQADLARDPRFRDLESRLANLEALDEVVGRWTCGQDAGDVAELLQSESIPAAPVYKATELTDNPQLAARGFFHLIEHPETGVFPYAGIGWRLSLTPGGLQGPSPSLGRDSRQVLSELIGMPYAKLESMWAAGVTGDSPPLDD